MLLGRHKTTRKNAQFFSSHFRRHTRLSTLPWMSGFAFSFWMNAWYVFFHSSVRVSCILLFNKKHIIPGWLCLYSKECVSFFYSLQTFQHLFDDALNTKPGISPHNQESTCSMQNAQKCCSRWKHDRCTEEFYLEVFLKEGKLALRTKDGTNRKLNINASNKDGKLFLNTLGYFFKEEFVHFVICF